jgi:hypothetical protein
MTLEFLVEALHGFDKSKDSLPGKQLSLNYITYWLPNLRQFCLPSDKPEAAANLEKTKQIIHMLIDLTVKEISVCILPLLIHGLNSKKQLDM